MKIGDRVKLSVKERQKLCRGGRYSHEVLMLLQNKIGFITREFPPADECPNYGYSVQWPLGFDGGGDNRYHYESEIVKVQ